MSSRQRLAVLGGAAACLMVVAVLAWMVTRDRSPLDSIDQWGRAAEDVSDNHATLVTFLRMVELAFATIGMTIWSGIVTVVLLSSRRFRAAAWVVVVMVTTALTTTLLKGLLARGRPDWQDHTDLLSSKSFPSGHASSTAALAGILILLVWTRGGGHSARRWAATTLVVAVWLLVCLDRVLPGRHYPTDVVAGSALGIAAMLIGLAVLGPISVRGPRDELVSSAR
jgi:membrane-associated phospholipid phosphatase